MVCGPHHRFGQTDENTRKHVLKLAKERDTCQPLTTRRHAASRTTPTTPNRATTRIQPDLNRGTESISNDKIGRLPNQFLRLTLWRVQSKSKTKSRSRSHPRRTNGTRQAATPPKTTVYQKASRHHEKKAKTLRQKPDDHRE
ncbi:hypothetical protein Bca52824_088621 [Brassica carinata]|uniref:Uncharacterized protein n=1 Tax=Brassica carinata TaxID=52824 RepID=A0A8X7PEC9_BRACI|nr:hypothetical protein Bca52824_088621 [Brassica carinata]